MFGYVRPVEAELCERDRARYRAVYCGLCHAIGRRCGNAARLTLNYDFAFLAMLLCPAETETALRAQRCLRHPVKGRTSCVGGPWLDMAAEESIILAWQKLRDDVADRGGLGGLPARGAALGLLRAYRRAAGHRPEFARQTAGALERLREMEEARIPSMDRTADAFAGILRAAVPEGLPGNRARTLEQLLYHLGRWIYLVDAWDDLEEDRAAGRYNPLLERFRGEPEAEYVGTTLTHSVKLAVSAYQLEEFGCWSPIIENVLYRGLPAVQEAVLTGRWRKRQEKFHE